MSPRKGDSAADSDDMRSTLATADAVELPSAASIFSGKSVSAIRHIVRDGVGVSRIDLAYLFPRPLVVEIEMVKTDQERIVVCGHCATDGEPQELYQSPRLLVPTVLGKAGDDVAN